MKRFILIWAIVVLFMVVMVGVVLIFVPSSCRSREGDEFTYGLKVTIKDRKREPLYVLLSACYCNDKRFHDDNYGYARGLVIAPPQPIRGDTIWLYCGRDPDFGNLMLHVAIWELPEWRGSRKDMDSVVTTNPAFTAVISRPDFNYSAGDSYHYVSFVEVQRSEDGRYKLRYPTPASP